MVSLTSIIALMVIAIFPTTYSSKTQARAEWMRSCTKKNKLVGYFSVENSTLYKAKNDGFLSADIEITQDLPPFMPTDITISRCASSTGRDCNVLLKYRERDLCVFFKPKNILSGEFVENFHPLMLCPLKKGNTYKLVNGTFGEGKASGYFQAVPGEIGKVTYYIGKALVKNGDEVVMCAEMMFRILKN
ncbi:hypothetical protein GE061_019575 [Apolygus lucorum]|uniref:MD-2-related lipid-recognition domain-containing protein n=1 Tax=Apolygus lucorum TaxID=248454 RepID=A0A8S9X903_APOLU|nr:hypothetical protein GE061_019575 [Apolygus lucorum]